MSKRKATKVPASKDLPFTTQVLAEREGSCSPPVLLEVLRQRSEHVDGEGIAAAAAMVWTLNHHGPRPSEDWLTVPLDLISRSHHPCAEPIMLHLARGAGMGRVRVEAIRRLGRLARSAGALDLLCGCVRNGSVGYANFQDDQVQLLDTRRAAVESLGEVRNPGDAEVACLLELAGAAQGRGADSSLFEPSIEALHKTARSVDIERILGLMPMCRNQQAKLALLGVCSKFDAEILQPMKSTIVREFLQAFPSFEPSVGPQSRLEILVARVTCQELVRGLGSQCSQLCLDRGKGSVASRAMEAYADADQSLSEAYLTCAQTTENIHPASRCIRGLTRCAQANNARLILSSVVKARPSGYEQLLRSGLLREVLGSPAAVVHGLCDAMDGLAAQSERDRVAPMACEGLLRVAVVDAAENVHVPRIESLIGQQRRLGQEDHAAWAATLQSVQSARETFGVLAERCSGQTEAPGAVALASVLLTTPRPVSEIFADALLRSTGMLRLEPGGFSRPNLPIAQLEEVLWTHHEQRLRANLANLVTTPGGPNRYALDLMRRRGVEFYAACRTTLDSADRDDDVRFVFASLAIDGSDDALRRAVEFTAFVPRERQIGEMVRVLALQTTADMTKARSRTEETIEFVLSRVHDRFQDALGARLAAYACCEALSSPRSIQPLKARSATDREPAALTSISRALDAIRTGLVEHPPDMQNPRACVDWLEYIGTLTDGSLVPHVKRYLCPPHPDTEVLSSALRCLESLGDAKAIDLIDEFEANVSPSADLLRVARRARAKLLKRQDVDLLDALSDLFPPESGVFDSAVNYVMLLGPGRVTTLAEGIKKVKRLWDDSHWDEVVTRVNSVCEILTRAVFELHYYLLGLDEAKGATLAAGEYCNRLRMSAFKLLFPSVQPAMEIIRELRQQADAAHLEKTDGTGRPGVEEGEALRALNEFRVLFPEYVQILQSRVSALSGSKEDRAEQDA